ncbi:hypothetical protein D7X55_26970 [Corallococcus sp. AB049A]|uniref:CARDB domain-containing protein n=1 Tax=Corallococcus sp. AB049A TaxID=2316721 RepID=UPI000ED55EFF|nr:CARDB domain-containing protein [Corallococcus sp. AB049A]RKI58383.1 hypothetical protein D7X55_26970 [Corallococcus sp. AB049A]
MPRLSPSWRHACLLITGTLVITGCGSEGASPSAKHARGQTHSLDQGTDLVITRLDAPQSVRDGSTLTVTAQVCNRGDAFAGGNGPTLLQVYLSTSPTQQVPAPGSPPPSGQSTVGQVDVGFLDPGACVTRTVSGPAIPPPGPQPVTALYLGASVDTDQQVQELDETNNGFVKGLMGVGTGADLVVTEVTAPTSVRDNASFLTEVRVCNVGTAPSPTTQAGIYLSTQTALSIPAPGTPSLSQIKVGEAFVPGLDAGDCIVVRTQAQALRPPNASLPTQPLYVGAIVDDAGNAPELREDNNAHVAGRMGVGMGPDLTVTGVVAPANLRHGEEVRTSVTVCNVGTAYSSPATVAVRLATQPSLTPLPQPPSPTTETEIGTTQLLMPLAAGQCTQVKVSGPAFAPSGCQPGQPLYLGAAVGGGSPSEPELREDNNTFVKGLVGLGNGPDLVIQSLKAPANLRPYAGFSAEARVCNVGTDYLGSAARLDLFLSTQDPVVLPAAYPGPIATPTQTPVGGADLWFLEAGQCTTVPVNANASLPPEFQPGKPLYLGAVIDTVRNIQELQEDNNVFTHGRVGVGTAPDLVVTDVQAPTNLRDGQSFTASYTVCNVGFDPISDYGVSLYLSLDAAPPVLGPSQYPSPQTGYAFLGRASSYAHLDSQRCATRSATFHAMRPYPSGPWDVPGTWHLSAVVDTGTQETRLDNNGFAAGLVGVGDGPDLVVTEVQGPASVRENETFTTRVKVCNVGTQPSNGMAPVAVYVGTEAVLQAPSQGAPPPPNDSQFLVGMLDVPPLDTGACDTQELSGQASRPYRAAPDQPLYLGAVADPLAQMQELREDNNTRVAGVISVGNGPDLVITSLEAPDSASTYETFIASARVCNVGTESSYSARVAFVLSAEETWELPPEGAPRPFPAPTQLILTEGSVQDIPAGECKTLTRTMRPMPPPGASPDQPVYLSAVVEPYGWSQAELRRDNNVHVRGRLGIGNGPELLATSVTAPPGVLPWVPFTTSVTVCNQGVMPSPSGVRATLHLLTTPSLPLPSPQNYPPYEELLADGILPQVGPHACVTFPMESIARSYGAQPEGQLFYVGITLDPNAYVMEEVRKDNNTFISPRRIAVGSAPDLVITAMGGPASVRPDMGGMTVPVTVCNQGTQPAQPRTVSIVLSTEPTLPQPPSQGGPIPPSSRVAVLGLVEIPDLPVNACATREENVPVSLPQGASPGAVFYLGAAVDGAGPGVELRTDNDTFVRGRIGVGNAPDLVITSVTAPFSVRRDEPFTTQVTVCNQGTENHYWGAQVELYLSTQPTLRFPGAGMSTSQVFLGNLPMDSLLAGQCTTSALTTTASWLPEGQGSGLFYLGALVDPYRSVTELREDNNAFVESFLAVLP